MHYPPYQRCVAVLLISSLLLQSCRPSLHSIVEESSPHPGTSTPATASIPSMAIGPKEWAQYFGEVGEAPPLPADIDKILDSPCSFCPDEQVKDTHLLVLVPETVDGKPLTLYLLGELIESPEGGGHATKYRFYDSSTKKQFGTQPSGKSHWVLMTRDVLEDSRNKSYQAQKALVAAHASRLRYPYAPYALPGALEAATAILMHHARGAGERLYTDDPWTYTRCQELVDNEYPVVVGGFSSGASMSTSTMSTTSTTVCRVSGSSRY